MDWIKLLYSRKLKPISTRQNYTSGYNLAAKTIWSCFTNESKRWVYCNFEAFSNAGLNRCFRNKKNIIFSPFWKGVRVKRGNGKTETEKRKSGKKGKRRKSGKKGKRRKSGKAEKRVKGGKAEKRVKGGKAEKRVKGGKAEKRVKGGKAEKRKKG